MGLRFALMKQLELTLSFELIGSFEEESIGCTKVMNMHEHGLGRAFNAAGQQEDELDDILVAYDEIAVRAGT